VSITDFGEGIPADKVPLVYNRYYRADTGIKSDGLGLGLFLCKQIITGHNGRVWITSKVNEGSTFSFSIPYKA
jgi:signal transduction histidine kinase